MWNVYVLCKIKRFFRTSKINIFISFVLNKSHFCVLIRMYVNWVNCKILHYKYPNESLLISNYIPNLLKIFDLRYMIK